MKTVYFVRHGESTSNAGPIVVGPLSELTDRGREQAAYIATRCKNLPLDIIVSSTFVRAKDTAQIIADQVGKTIEYSDLFVERRRPSEEIGVRRDSALFSKVGAAMRAHFPEPGWRYSDEENFDDLKERAGTALRYLAARPEQHLLVVTHSFFLRTLLARAIFGDSLTGKECQDVLRGFEMENTGITILHHQPEEYYTVPGSEIEWRVWVWNDHAHLG
jgi:probable phosphoglycerate mutase